MKKKIIALILCVCLISCTCIQPAYAMGAEGIIVGGGAAAAGVTLTMPQVALLVAAGFGLVYATQHAEEIYRGLDTAMTNAANNIEGGIDQLATWTNQAAQGEIAIANAPSWIVDSIKEWINGLYQTANGSGASSDACFVLPAGTSTFTSTFWFESYPVTSSYNKDVTVLRTGGIQEITLSGLPYWKLTSYYVAVSTEKFDYSKEYTYNGVTYYYQYTSSSANPSREQPLAGDNLLMYNALTTLPNHFDFIAAYPDISYSPELIIAGWADGLFNTNSVCPDKIVGGIDNALGQHAIDNIKVPDLDIGGSGLLAPDNVGSGSIDDVLNDILTRLKTQELSWADYMDRVAVGTPSITIDGKDYAIDDTGVTDIPVEDVVPDNPPVDGVVVPEGLEPFTMSLTDFFPFCIPFDIVDFVNVLCAEPEAPCFDWTFTWYGGDTDTLTIDLSPFDQVAQLLRNMELLLFCIGLALITRNQIRG